MSFLETPARRFRLVLAVGMGVLGAFLASMPLLVDIDETGRHFVFFIVAVCFLLAAWNLWFMRRVDSADVVTPAWNAPPGVLGSNDRILLWMSIVAFPTVTIFTAIELRDLERGEVEQVELLVPLSLIYEHLGYWPTVAIIPIVGVVCVIFLYRSSKSSTEGS